MSMLSRRNRPSDMPRVEPQAVRSPDKGVFIDFATIEMITQTCRSVSQHPKCTSRQQLKVYHP